MHKEYKTIFLVDDSVTNLTIGKNALIDRYNVFTIPSGQKLLQMLEKIMPDLILLDVEMPEMNGYDVIRKLKSMPDVCDIPVVFLTAKTDTQSELEGFYLGAIDYITKPFSPPLLLKRIEVHLLVEQQKKELKNYNENLMLMVEEKTRTIVKLKNAILNTVAELVECRDDVTGFHIERVQSFLKILLDKLIEQKVYTDTVSQWDLEVFLNSAQLHDVGKIKIKDEILQKPGKLTEEEFEQMKMHTVFGEQIIDSISKNASEDAFLTQARILAGTHHEKWNGTGYPRGLSGDDIPLQGRLMAIVDVYDALTSERSYKKAFSHESAVQIILKEQGKHFDPVLIDIFKMVVQEFALVSQTVVKGGQ